MPNTEPTIFGLALNRIVAFVGPYIATVSGAIATWLIAKVNIVGIPGLDQANIQTGITAAITFLVVTAVTWAGHHKWLTGYQHWAAQTVASDEAAVQPDEGLDDEEPVE